MYTINILNVDFLKKQKEIIIKWENYNKNPSNVTVKNIPIISGMSPLYILNMELKEAEKAEKMTRIKIRERRDEFYDILSEEKIPANEKNIINAKLRSINKSEYIFSDVGDVNERIFKNIVENLENKLGIKIPKKILEEF